MNENSFLLFYYIYLLYINFEIPVIHTKERACYFLFLGSNFFPLNSGYRRQNQLVSRPAIN